MHGLVSETSICYWQGQPESYIRRRRRPRTTSFILFVENNGRRRDGTRRWPFWSHRPPPAAAVPLAWKILRAILPLGSSSSSSFSPCRYRVHVRRHHRFPFLRGRGATVACGQDRRRPPLGRVRPSSHAWVHPRRAPTCAASATARCRCLLLLYNVKFAFYY